jgi:hypothetical protein
VTRTQDELAATTRRVSAAGVSSRADDRPLEERDVARAEEALRRLHEASRDFLGALPADANSATGLASMLEVDRTTCQRLCYVCHRAFAGLGSIGRYPGARALRAIVRAAEDHALAPEERANLERAATHLERTVKEVAGSVSRLERRLATAPAPMGVGANDDEPRAALTSSAAAITGRCSRAWIATYYLRQAPGRENALEVSRIEGLHAHTARPPAAPLIFQNFGAPDRAPTGKEASGSGFMPEFCSDLEAHITKRTAGSVLSEVIEFDESHDELDIFCRYAPSVEPTTAPGPGFEEVWALINLPAHAMVLDVHLDRALARRCLASADAHLWQPDFASSRAQRWATRLPEQPELTTLTSRASLETPYYYRMPELTDRLFEQAGVDRSTAVGFRCAIEHPLWRCGYRLLLDFGEE